MATALQDTLRAELQDKFVTIDGLRIRYIEEGQGKPVVCLHGASLGSSADVFRRNMGPLARAGFRVIAFDQPGFGLSDNPEDHGAGLRKKMVTKLIDALGLGKVAFLAHSQAGNAATQIALAEPERVSHVIVLGTGSLLPPLEAKPEAGADRQAAVQQRLERRMAASEPTIDDTRKLLEANLFHHELITPEELALRHKHSTGKNFAAFVARNELSESNKQKPKDKTGPEPWETLTDLKMPLLLIYGKNDRANAFEKATLLKERRPQLDLHIVDGCKHLVPWDAADDVQRLVVPFLKR
ncbi:MAG TPA: alpha/beta hydrolase [Alphaproteobacteria bacterium]|nr:alpha/beta hydrolase [Alphaproteobacteria bacterium]